MNGEVERFRLNGRNCACFVPKGGSRYAVCLCGWEMERMLPSLTDGLPKMALLFVQADGGRDFTPWPAPSPWEGEAYSGGAEAYLRFLMEEAFPWVEERCGTGKGPGFRGIAGYSLAGLFSLWALCKTGFFGQGASLSGSLWYEGFPAYLREHPPREGQRVYLSLGDREEFGGPPLLRTVGNRTREAESLLSSLGRDVVLEWNKGGHGKGVEGRWKKALLWMAAGFYNTFS